MSNSDFVIENGVLKKYNGAGGDVVIPEGVKSISPGAFMNCKGLTSIIIPDSVISIGGHAFEGCEKLMNISLPSKISEIRGDTFSKCRSLKHISIPDSVKNIGSEAFHNCKSLTNITIPGNVISIEEHAFDYCGSLKAVIIQDGTTSIGWSAFSNCTGLESVTVPDSVTNIDGYAFGYCKNLVAIRIPGNITKISSGLFYKCSSLKNINIPDGITGIGDSAFSGCTELISVTIPDSVTNIGEHAFFGCAELQSIKLTDTVISVGESAFSGCSGLMSVEVSENNPVYHSSGNCLIETKSKTLIAGCNNSSIPDDGSVTNIANGAFTDRIALTEITIPACITNIGLAFSGCTSLSSITVADGNPVYQSHGNCLIEIKSKTLIAGCKDSIIPDDGSVEYIGERAFVRCTGLTSVTIQDSIIGIGQAAFFGCSGLTELSISENVKCIADFAFSGCIGLSSVTVPKGITEISHNAFAKVKLVIYEGNDKKAPWGAKNINRFASYSVDEKFESGKDLIGNSPFSGKKIAFIGVDLQNHPELKQKMKAIGCSAVKTVSKDIDIAVYSEQLIGPDSKYRSAVYQKDKNGKHLWKYSEFISELKKCGIDTSDIEDANIRYKTDTRENQLASLGKAINDNIYFLKHEDILKFNDDFYEVEWTQNSGKYLDFDDDVLKALEKYDTQTILGTDADIKSIINAFGGCECIENIIATCIATRMFLDPKFECRFRIYRDKWEYRGDYGMMYGKNEIPPAIYWEINKRHPFGYCLML